MNRLDRFRDPVATSVAVFGGLAVAGFAAIYLGWRVAARTLVVSEQVPALVSGGFGGLLLVAVGVGLLTIQVRRRLVIAERVQTEAVLEELARVVDAARARQGSG